MDSSKIDLGFAEECPAYLLTNRYFPSKIGGKPAWLDLKNLPQPEDLQCSKCKEPLSFLCQVYAPIETDPAAFHRTIFIFICKSAGCSTPNSAENIIALRSQLRRENEFYSPIAADEEEELPAIESAHMLCEVCGCLGPMKCSQCKSVFYCSKSHQRIDWKNGHKQACQNSSSKLEANISPILFPEFDIEIEPEPEDAISKSDDSEEAEQRRKEEFKNLVKEGKTGQLSDVPEEELARYTSTDADKTFHKFKKRIQQYPEQVLRYEREGEPLFITMPVSDEMFTIPNCTSCQSARVFEFQVMPQLLNYLKEDSLDWGTIMIYTCSESCDTKSTYLKEHVVKQDVTVQEVLE